MKIKKVYVSFYLDEDIEKLVTKDAMSARINRSQMIRSILYERYCDYLTNEK